MKLRTIAISLLCAVLLASCTAEVAEPAHDTPLDEIELEIITPAPQRNEIKLEYNYESALSLIIDEETELTAELRELVGRFKFPLLPRDGTISIGHLCNFHSELWRQLSEERRAELYELYPVSDNERIYVAELLDAVFAELFSENFTLITNFVQITPNWHEYVDYNTGAFTWGFTENPWGHRLILKEQSVSEETVELYFYALYTENRETNQFIRNPGTWNHEEGGIMDFDDTVVGRWSDSYIAIYEDTLDTLDIVKYTFILEDGRYKILSIENVT
jgi:hypothetical protein